MHMDTHIATHAHDIAIHIRFIIIEFMIGCYLVH